MQLHNISSIWKLGKNWIEKGSKCAEDTCHKHSGMPHVTILLVLIDYTWLVEESQSAKNNGRVFLAFSPRWSEESCRPSSCSHYAPTFLRIWCQKPSRRDVCCPCLFNSRRTLFLGLGVGWWHRKMRMKETIRDELFHKNSVLNRKVTCFFQGLNHWANNDVFFFGRCSEWVSEWVSEWETNLGLFGWTVVHWYRSGIQRFGWCSNLALTGKLSACWSWWMTSIMAVKLLRLFFPSYMAHSVYPVLKGERHPSLQAKSGCQTWVSISHMNHVNRLTIHYCFLKFPLNLSVHLPLRCLFAVSNRQASHSSMDSWSSQ